LYNWFFFLFSTYFLLALYFSPNVLIFMTMKICKKYAKEVKPMQASSMKQILNLTNKK
jgi:hypothetical protein